MFTLLLRFYRGKFLSRWTVLFFVLTATLLTLVASIAIRFNFSVDHAQRVLDLPSFIAVLGLYAIGYISIGSHKGILRHVEFPFSKLRKYSSYTPSENSPSQG